MRKNSVWNKELTRRQILQYGLYGGLMAGLSGSALIGGCTRYSSAKMPNIVFILVDTLRADHLPTYGYKTKNMSKIEQLAKQGVVFENVIAQSSWTKTSMASIMTSSNPSRHGAMGVKDVLPEDLTTIAEGLAAEGYYTIGINTNPWLRSQFRFHVGFDNYQSYPLIDSQEWNTARMVNHEALQSLNEVPKGKPFFLYLHYMDVHSPYRPRAPFHVDDPLTLPGLGKVSNDKLEWLYRIKGLRNPDVIRRIIELYDCDIRNTDYAIDELVTKLMGKGWFNNTILVITSDHGEEFYEHGESEHGKNLYPEVIRVPLIFVWPGHLPKGKRIRAQVRTIDIGPTLFDLAGLSIPDMFEGITLMPMEENAHEDRIAISEVGLNDYRPDRHYVAVISHKYMYIREKITNAVEFYDLQLDDSALNNLGSNHPESAYYAKIEKTLVTRRTEQTDLDKQTIEQLKSLGYLK